jgi:hypothetical protein
MRAPWEATEIGSEETIQAGAWREPVFETASNCLERVVQLNYDCSPGC